MAELHELVDGVDFGEGPRWRDGALWYSDFYQRAVYRVRPDGQRSVVHGELDDRPSGLGWLPDGRLMVVSMTTHRVLVEDGHGGLVVHADLDGLAAGHCNDMVVDAQGRAYVGNFGFDLEAAAEPQPTAVHLVDIDGSVRVAADDLMFPNGAVITPDQSTLIVGETFGMRYTAFTIAADGSLTDRRIWADTPGMFPDGCTLDAAGGIWFADAAGARVVRVLDGGEITDEIATPMPVFACMLGGDDGRTLFVLCAPGSAPEQVAGVGGGKVLTTQVEHPHAGQP